LKPQAVNTMSSVAAYPHITIDANGVARIGDTRYKVLYLAGEHFHYCWTAEEIRRQHPDLRPEEVYAALTYFYDHYDEMVRQLQENAEYAASMRSNNPLTRAELLERKKRLEER
jgi:uncharacterized protein (DUF433 family)